MLTRQSLSRVFSVFLVVLIMAGTASARPPNAPLGTAFTYQGKLTDGGAPANGAYDLEFRLYDALSGGSPVGGTVTRGDVTVANGLFTVQLDFGDVFDGAALYLAIGVRPGASVGAYAALDPRQSLTAAPYSFYAASTGALQGYPVNATAPATGLVLKWNGSAWAPGVDTGGTAYSAGFGLALAGSQFHVVTSTIQQRITGACSAGNAIRVVNADGSVTCEPLSTGNFWGLSGNAGTSPSTNYLGTTDAVSLTLRVNNVVGWRLSPSGADTPNVIGGYSGNVISSTVVGGTIGGGGASGLENRVQANYAAVGGGYNNTASSDVATVGGGGGNIASGYIATVGGGYNNTASNQYATVGGGYFNTASGQYATVGGGLYNTANGYAAAIPGGYLNTAAGSYSFAAGNQAKANHIGAFVWGDSTWAEFASTANNQFLVRASGGITLYTNSGATVGAALAPGSGSWSVVSDRNLKENLTSVDSRDILARLVSIPIQTWNYTTQDASIRHIGPMAQDFRAAFGAGENDTTISTVDAQGVALAAIKGLYQVVQDKDTQIAALQQQNTDLAARVSKLEQNATATNLPSQAEPFTVSTLLSVVALIAAGWIGLQQRRSNRGQS